MNYRTKKLIAPYLFFLPGFVLFAIFLVYPLAKGFQMSFFRWAIMPGKPSTFVGLDNYLRVFQDSIAGIAFRNTVVYALVTVAGQMILAMLVALLLNSIIRGKVFFRTLYYLPVVTSWVIASLLFRYLFQSPEGLVNYFLVDFFHVVSEPVAWLEQAGTAMVPILGLGIWKGVGWTMIIYLAALVGLPKEILEASAIDGASAWQRFWYVTLPLISPTVVFTLVMLLIGGFNVFISVYMITNGGPMQQTEVMLSYMYHQAFDFLDFGYGSAISFLMASLLITASFLQMKYLRRPVETY
ncbi:MAG TPA: sugar ABC transporter permease [Anaerolineales bacterium]